MEGQICCYLEIYRVSGIDNCVRLLHRRLEKNIKELKMDMRWTFNYFHVISGKVIIK